MKKDRKDEECMKKILVFLLKIEGKSEMGSNIVLIVWFVLGPTVKDKITKT